MTTVHREAVALILAGKKTLKQVSGYRPIRDPNARSLEHARWMLEQISLGKLDNLKAATWLGYAQALIVVHNEASLQTMTVINREAKEQARVVENPDTPFTQVGP